MANEKYFATCNGAISILNNVQYVPVEKLEAWRRIANIPEKAVRMVNSVGPQGNTYSYAAGLCSQCGAYHVAERLIFRKANPSNHKCDARCLNATGHNCECSCGGKNHGKAA